MYMVIVQLLFYLFSFIGFVGSHEQEVEQELCEIEPDLKSPKSAKAKGMLVMCNIHVLKILFLCLLVKALCNSQFQ